ncbi:MAG TPA: potassium channel family protein [Acidobacteriaceae bacterium]|nr:potassium channel family protein [Acidobacteriaceae bacterium]
MRFLTLILGVLCLAEVLLDAFQTIILPRRASGRFRVSRIVMTAMWIRWRFIAGKLRKTNRRESFLSYFGPLSLLMLVVIWAIGLIFGFGLLFHGIGSPFADAHSIGKWETDLYVSGTTLFTLGLGDVVPLSVPSRILVALEGGMGLAFVAGVIGYLPVLYGAFSRREVSIILLDARAGSPPTALELLRRHSGSTGELALQTLLVEWERWSAELLESHISYPQLCFFRSQHDNQSWLSALVAMLDTCAVLIATVEGDAARQAQLTFVMARHAVLDLAHIFGLKGGPSKHDRLPQTSLESICEQLSTAGFKLCAGDASVQRLRELRSMYEPEAFQLGRLLMQELPPFYPQPGKRSNWTQITGLRSQTEASLLSADQRKSLAVNKAAIDESHSF